MRKSAKTTRILTAMLLALCIALGSGSLAFAATGATPTADPAAPVGTVTKVTIAFYGDTGTTKGFTWYTTAASINSDLQVVEKKSRTANFNAARVMRFTGKCDVPTNAIANTLNKAQEYLHKAEATGLKPGRTYYFRVGDAALNLWSETGTFTTASASGAFTFLDLADPQAKELEEAQLSAETYKQAVATVPNASFIVTNGDFVDKGNIEYQWDWLLDNMKGVTHNYTFAPVAGNHEEQASSFIDHFDLKPAAGSPTTTGAYYSYDYRNAHFVMLNTNENSAEFNDFTPAQIDWMKADVQKARADGATWIIAVLHKGPYTTSNHATDGDIMGAAGVRNLVAPIMAELNIDLVLQGHDHIYARSKPIMADGTAATESIITECFRGRTVKYQVNNAGTVYMIPATAGPKVYYKNKTIDPSYYNLFDVADENHAAIYGPDPADATRPMRSQVQNFSSITIDGDKLSVVTYEIDLHKSAKPFVVDTFGLFKDHTAPVIRVRTNKGDNVANGASVKSGFVRVSYWENNLKSKTATLNGKAIVWARDGKFTKKGSYTFTVTDKAGNVSTFKVNLK